jgi:preprotein translocase subunit SecF
MAQQHKLPPAQFFEILRIRGSLPFMRYALPFISVSIVAVLISLGALYWKGLNLGIDFTGGTVIEVDYPEAADIDRIRKQLAEVGYPDAIVVNFGSAREVLIRMPIREGLSSAQLSEQVLAALRATDPKVDLRRVEFVGPAVGAELLHDGSLALLFVTALIMAYLWLRFEWKFSVGAIAATAHDVILILGLFALFQLHFDLTVLAAVLAVLGYSVNDTVVVFDRIRENFRKMRRGTTPEIVDASITATLPRTILLSFSTQLMVCAMLVLGGDVLFYFALALTIGIVVGTYSSIFVASTVTMWLGLSREDFIRPEKKSEHPDGAQV